jgi:TPR repeat protein
MVTMQVMAVVAGALLLSSCDERSTPETASKVAPKTSSDEDCAKQGSADCTDRARAMLFGDGGVKKDPTRARDLAISECERGIAAGCTLAGLAYSSAFADAVTARRWLQRGCDQRDGVGCAALAYQYFEGGLAGDAGGVARDPNRGAELASRACELGAPKGCALLAKALASGEGITADVPRARELSTSACRADEPAGCAIAAKIAQHDGRSEDELRFQSRACALGYRPACR